MKLIATLITLVMIFTACSPVQETASEITLPDEYYIEYYLEIYKWDELQHRQDFIVIKSDDGYYYEAEGIDEFLYLKSDDGFNLYTEENGEWLCTQSGLTEEDASRVGPNMFYTGFITEELKGEPINQTVINGYECTIWLCKEETEDQTYRFTYMYPHNETGLIITSEITYAPMDTEIEEDTYIFSITNMEFDNVNLPTIED